MYNQPSYLELQIEERARELSREIEQDTVAAQLPRRASFLRRGLRLFGRSLIAVGMRLNSQEQTEQAVVYSSQ